MSDVAIQSFYFFEEIVSKATSTNVTRMKCTLLSFYPDFVEILKNKTTNSLYFCCLPLLIGNTMNNTCIVLEGGGLRGAFTCGVLEFLLENKLNFDRVIGVSAGA